MLKDNFVLNPFKLNLNKDIREKGLKLDSPNLFIEVNQKKLGSIPPSLLMEHERESTLISKSINSLVRWKNLPITIAKDLQVVPML